MHCSLSSYFLKGEFKGKQELGMMMHTCNFNSLNTETGELPVLGPTELHRDRCNQNNNYWKKNKTNKKIRDECMLSKTILLKGNRSVFLTES